MQSLCIELHQWYINWGGGTTTSIICMGERQKTEPFLPKNTCILLWAFFHPLFHEKLDLEDPQAGSKVLEVGLSKFWRRWNARLLGDEGGNSIPEQGPRNIPVEGVVLDVFCPCHAAQAFLGVSFQ